MRLPRLTVALWLSKTRIVHDLTFLVPPRANSVNAGKYFEEASLVDLGRIMRDIIWRISYLRRCCRP